MIGDVRFCGFSVGRFHDVSDGSGSNSDKRPQSAKVRNPQHEPAVRFTAVNGRSWLVPIY
jgi:hypothetical protein